ncbi:MAG TPA: hypothetical protein ENJ32_05665 [Crenotrichaceae bacterium]|nr:hypothetical protein [Crenotrichaceae bacterium]
MDREVFRLIILIIGLLVMAGIYLFDPGRRQQAREKKPWHEEGDGCSSDSEIMEYVRTVNRDEDQLNFDEDLSERDDSDVQLQDLKTVVQKQAVHYQNSSVTVSQTDAQAANKSVSTAEAELISALNESEAPDDEDGRLFTEGELLSPFSSKFEAELDSELEINASLLEPLADPDTAANQDQGESEKAPSIILLHLVAEDGTMYPGQAINNAFRKAELHYGSMEIYHYRDQQHNQDLFSAANIREPGTFPEQMDRFETDGIILFMQPMTVENPLQVFDKMVVCADTLFTELGGKMLDEKRLPITKRYLEQQRRWLLLN